MSGINPYAQHLDKCAANFQPLSPLPFLQRAAAVYPQRIAVIHGQRQDSYAEFYRRTRRLASALRQRGIGPADTVSAMLATTAARLEAHCGGPMNGAVLHAMHTRLDAALIAVQIDPDDAQVWSCDPHVALASH